MMRNSLIVFLLLILTACGDNIPKDVLSKKEMVSVQWDLMRADEMVDYYRALDTTYPAEEKRKEFYAQIMKLHGIDQQKFDHSLDFYTSHPPLLKELLDSLQSRAGRQPSADGAPTQKVLPDSLLLEEEDSEPVPKRINDTPRLRKLLKPGKD